MAKLGHQQAPTAEAPTDVANKQFVENFGANPVTASGDYMRAAMSTGMVDVVAGNVLTFDTNHESRGALALVANQVTGLKAGRTYLLMATCRINGATFGGGAVDMRWYDDTAGGYVGAIHAEVSSDGTSPFSSNGHATYLFTPTVDTTMDVRVTFADAGADLQSFGSGLWVMEVGATVVNAVGGLEFIDRITVAGSAAASVTFGAGGDGALGRALDGDIDEHYVLISNWKNSDTPTTRGLNIRPNGVSTAQKSRKISNGTPTDEGAIMRISETAWDVAHGVSEIVAKTGRIRTISTQIISVQDSALDVAVQGMSGAWNEEVTNITSLEIITPAGSFIGVDSEFTLYRRTASIIRADSADTYERSVEAAVAVGTATEEYTTGHTAFGGSAIGLTARIEDAVTAGTVVVNLKVDGATVLSTTLDTTNPTSNRAVAPLGAFLHGADKNVSVEVVATGYDNVGSVDSGLTVVGVLVNDALVQSQSQAYMPGHLDGLKVTFNTVSTVDIEPGTMRDSANTANIDVLATLTADIAVSGVNGLDTGSESSSTWYALYAIKNIGLGTVASLLSESFTSPTLPVGYDVFRRVGAVLNNSGSSFPLFRQRGVGRDRVVYWHNGDDFGVVTGGSATTWSGVDCSFEMPPSSLEVQLMVQLDTPTAGDFIKVRPTGGAGRAGSYGTGGTNAIRHAPILIPTDISQNFEYEMFTSGSMTVSIWVLGWTDSL
jgi:hypothetical protein